MGSRATTYKVTGGADVAQRAGEESRTAKACIVDPFEAHRKRPLVEHLDDFRRELEARLIVKARKRPRG
jgi:hypothetical protein